MGAEDMKEFLNKYGEDMKDLKIESLRQQLVAMTADRDDCLSLAKLNFAKWYESQKREVILRVALEYCVAQVPELGTVPGIEEALAATADLKDVILCHAEPVAYMIKCKYQVMGFVPTQEKGTIPVFAQKETK